MYNGTCAGCSKPSQSVENVGAAYRIRTCDPIITNKGYPRQNAVFSPNCVPIYPICAVFVRFSGRFDVRVYIGPEADGNPLPALTTDAVRCAMARFDIPPGWGWVYIVGTVAKQPIKIGRTADVTRRIIHIQVGNPSPIMLFAAFESTDAKLGEGKLHAYFERDYLRGEWFTWSPRAVQIMSAINRGCPSTLRLLCGTGLVQRGGNQASFRRHEI